MRVSGISCLLAFATASLGGADFDPPMLVGEGSMGDYCGDIVAGGPIGLPCDPDPVGLWSFPTCSSPISQLQCIKSPFMVGWFGDDLDPTIDQQCCMGNEVYYKYQAVWGGEPTDLFFYECREFVGG